MRNRRERGTGLIFGLFVFLFVTTVAAAVIARSAMHAKALHWGEKKIEALAIAEAGVELIGRSDRSRLQQQFGRGQFVATCEARGNEVIITSRGLVRTATGAEVASAVRVRERRVGGEFLRKHWEIVR